MRDVSEQELRARAGDVSARLVFGDPVERDGVTVVPAAKLGAGWGGGGGEGPGGASGGSGWGFGFGARPAGAYVIRDGRVTWQPAVDVNRIVLGGQVVGCALALAVVVVLGRRRSARAGTRGSG